MIIISFSYFSFKSHILFCSIFCFSIYISTNAFIFSRVYVYTFNQINLAPVRFCFNYFCYRFPFLVHILFFFIASLIYDILIYLHIISVPCGIACNSWWSLQQKKKWNREETKKKLYIREPCLQLNKDETRLLFIVQSPNS
jgi:hypothetical protein